MDHTVVSGDALSPSTVKRAKHWLIENKLRVGLIALLLTVVVAGVMLKPDKEQPIAEGPKCTSSQVSRGVAALEPKQVDKLDAVVKEIRKIPGYDQDQNCLYLELTYYLNISDSKAARAAYTKLKIAHTSDKDYSPALAGKTDTTEELETRVKFLESKKSQFYGGFSGGEGSD